MKIKMHRCKSSTIERYAYDEFDQALYVQYKGSQITLYKYKQVSSSEYQQLETAKSKGSYIAQHIKPWKTCEKLDFESMETVDVTSSGPFLVQPTPHIESAWF